MKKLFLMIPLIVLAMTGCNNEYDDTEIWNKLNSLDSRVTTLEQSLTGMNSSIEQMRKLISQLDAKMRDNVSITSVTQTTNGYEITFSDGTTMTLRNGIDGQDGKDGKDGKDGQNGKDGKDGQTPYVGANGNWWIGTTDTGIQAKGQNGKDGLNGKDGKDGLDGKDGKDGLDGKDGQTPYIGSNGNWWIGNTDTGVIATGSSSATVDFPVIGIEEYNGVYYWTQTVNGVRTWLTDKNGDKIPVTAAKPIIRVDYYGYWIISYDNGVTFEYILDANGNRVVMTNCDCTTFFQSVSYQNGVLILVLVDGTVIRIVVEQEHDDRLDVVVPSDVQEKIIEHMPLYAGVNPPNVEGVYLIEPMVAVYCEDGQYEAGHKVIETVIRLSNQNTKDNTIDYDDYEGTVQTATGKGAFISGSGNNFTAFFNTEGLYYGDTYTKTALVISGTKTDDGIRDLYYAFVMVEKDGPNVDRIMEEGIFRIFKDEDGLSVNTIWSPESASRSDNPFATTNLQPSFYFSK